MLADDYIVILYAEKHPPESRSGIKAGETVNFELFLRAGLELSGTVTDSDGYPAGSVTADIFEKDGNFIESVQTDNNGNFIADNLSSDKMYQLRFTAYINETEIVQWAGEDETGIEETDSEKNPEYARAYKPGETVNFRFSNPLQVRDLNQQRRNRRSALSESIRNLSLMPVAEIFNTPNVTVMWESSEESEDIRYYSLFDKNSDSVVTKRNVHEVHPFISTRVTSENLSGDDIPYYFHVATVDRRGRIGDTKHVAFRIDTVAPINATVITFSKTESRFVKLVLGATGATEMYISNTGYGKSGLWENWVKNKEWKITEEEGLKKIYVQYRDRAKNISNAIAVTEKVLWMPQQYTVSAAAGTNGKIEPSGEIIANAGENMTFTITPDSEYETDKLFIDGYPITVTGNTYIFENITEEHTISVTFKLKPVITHIITAVAGEHGITDPTGEVVVTEGTDKTFMIIPNEGYEADTVLVDGKPVRLTKENTFQFINLQKDYTLSVTFKPKSAITYTITATAGEHGSIIPSGSITADQGTDKEFTFVPADDYKTDAVLIDGAPVVLNAENSYIFRNIAGDHQIHVTFSK